MLSNHATPVPADGHLYNPHIDAAHVNTSMVSEFNLELPSADINVLDINKRSFPDTEKSESEDEGELGTNQAALDDVSDLGSLKSFKLLNVKDEKSIQAKSLPNEAWDGADDENADDERSVMSLARLPTIHLNNHELSTYAQKAAQLNEQIGLQEQATGNDTGHLAPEKPELSADNMSSFSKTSIVRCNCKKSKCLRLHCVCFAELRECSAACNCCGCKNNEESREVREFVIAKTREINPLAFKPKIKNFKGMNVNSRGCNCSKNNCLKRYCECYKSGSGCTKLCSCLACKNSKETLSTEEITNIKDKGYRRKHKIVISDATLDKRDQPDTDSAVKFVRHKKKRKNMLD